MGNYGYYGDYGSFGGYVDPDFAAGFAALGALVGVFLVIIGIMLLFEIVSYVLGAIGLHTLANRRGIRHGWLAWLPYGNVWILGSISDQFQYVVKGKIRSRRKVLLGLNIALTALTIPLGVALVFLNKYLTDALTYGSPMPDQMVVMLPAILIFALIVLVVSIVLLVHAYIAYYNMFFSCSPDDAALFLVLGILFPVAMPFFVFSQRKKDNGMPPRKPDMIEE